jgi:hypothetical protein
MARSDTAAGGRRVTPAGQRPAAGLAVLLVLVLAACGGSATASPGSGQSTGPDATSEPGDTPGPVETQDGGATDAPGDGTAAFTAAMTALDNLDSYTYSVDIEAVDTTSGSSHTRLTGTVVNTDDARLVSFETLDVDGTVTDSSALLFIGSDAWTRQGGEGEPWTAIPAAQADIFAGSFSAFRPEQMFGVYFAAYGGSFNEVGTETKNGVETIHYQGDESLGTILGAIAGVQGSWSSDAWIATDGGYLVHSEASAEAAAGGEGGSFRIVVDINEIDSAGPLEPPA